MGSIRRYAAIYTKVKSLESHLLSDSQYLMLLNAKNLNEVIKLLIQQTPYGSLLSTAMSAAEVERVLRQYLFNGYEQIIHYTTNEDRKLFKLLIMRYEIELLKSIIRAVSKGRLATELAGQFPQSNHFKIRDFNHLSMCHSLEELVADLTFTEYGPLLKPYLNQPSHMVLFYMEMVLDRYYFSVLSKQMNRLSGEGKGFMLELLGTNIDLLNMQWLYRGKKYYHVSPEVLFNFCLKEGYTLNLKTLRELCYLDGIDAFIEALSSITYGDLFMNQEQLSIVLERDIERALYILFLRLMKKGHLNLVTPIGYLHQLEYELRDVFSIMEAKRYGMNASLTANFLVRVIQGETLW